MNKNKITLLISCVIASVAFATTDPIDHFGDICNGCTTEGQYINSASNYLNAIGAGAGQHIVWVADFANNRTAVVPVKRDSNGNNTTDQNVINKEGTEWYDPNEEGAESLGSTGGAGDGAGSGGGGGSGGFGVPGGVPIWVDGVCINCTDHGDGYVDIIQEQLIAPHPYPRQGKVKGGN